MYLDEEYVLEAPSEKEKRRWLALPRSRAGYMPTAQMHGPRLMPLKPGTVVDTVNFLGLLDPWDASGVSELEDEWGSIPKVVFSPSRLSQD